jgi:hypothetical protein
MYTLDIKDAMLVLKALYWYQDKVQNQERAIGRDISEWDDIMWLRTNIGNKLKSEAKID